MGYQFREWFKRLQAYVEREGHAKVPDTYKDETGFGLGNWVTHRRMAYKTGTLSSQQIKTLEALPGWVWDPFEDKFQVGLKRLRAYVERKGEARVPMRFTDETGFKLGTWVGSRRKEYNRVVLSPDRIEALEAVPGWVWEQVGYQFREGFKRLQAYVEREGHARVPQSYKDETGFRLGNWVTHRRKKYKTDTLSSERIKALEVVPGWVWDTYEDQYQVGLKRLRAYVEREDHARVPMGHPNC